MITPYPQRIGKELCQISPKSLEWIDHFLTELKELTGRKKLKIIEFGSGVSTVALATLRPDDEIISIEENREWYENVKRWLADRNIKNVNLIFEEVEDRNYYIFDETTNSNYFHVSERFKPFDLVINDGNMREYIGDSILNDADNYLTKGGLYLRHDYEKAWKRTWIGPHLFELDWLDGSGLGYDAFCASHEGYDLLTIGGNGTWGYKAEFGGVWRLL